MKKNTKVAIGAVGVWASIGLIYSSLSSIDLEVYSSERVSHEGYSVVTTKSIMEGSIYETMHINLGDDLLVVGDSNVNGIFEPGIDYSQIDAPEFSKIRELSKDKKRLNELLDKGREEYRLIPQKGLIDILFSS